MAFHEVLFPITIAYGSSGGPTRKTDVITLDSGYEQRNTSWSASRHTFNVSTGVKSYDDIYEIKAFWEARTGALNGFRFRDFSDYRSLGPSDIVSKLDQTISSTVHPANGSNTVFQLIKTYTDSVGTYIRTINKPVSGTVLIADNGTLKTETTDYTIDYTTGLVTFGTAPTNGHTISAGYQFDVPCRFQADSISINLADFVVGNLDPINLIELRV